MLKIIPVNIYCESALNAASHTQRFGSCCKTCTSEKSVVLQILAVWSADVVTNKLQHYKLFNLEKNINL